MKISKLLIILLLASANPALAQWQIGIGLSSSAPVDRFAGHNYPWGYSIDLVTLSPNVLQKSDNWGLQFGLNLSGGDAGRKSFDTNRALEQGTTEFYNCIVSHQATTRFGYQIAKKHQLYLEGIIGHTKFHSGRMSVSGDDNIMDDGHKDHLILFKDRTFRYGGAIGTTWKLKPNTRLELRVDYTRGTAAQYINMNSITKTEDGYHFRRGYSEYTDQLNIHLNIVWTLRRPSTWITH
ncbi:MAG: hypothetical protein ACI9JN_001739 [Bacteroidia bacterium]|jgi:hypothetical protein